MILAGDIGGTKTLVGLFQPGERRPVPVDVRSYQTTAFVGLPAMLESFFSARGNVPHIASAVFGVAGPVIDQTAEMTNVEWAVSADEVGSAFGIPRVRLLNDLEAMAHAVPVLHQQELITLQQGRDGARGNIALVAAGTGLGGSILHLVNGTHVPVATEIGHTDFAARTGRELRLVEFIRGRYGRAEIEHVVCGPGLLNLAEFTHGGLRCETWSGDTASVATPAQISESALTRRCAQCVEALDMFVEAYGAVAGNLALTGMTSGGVFIGGGIAPRILPALQTGAFLDAFAAKGPMKPLLEDMAVHVITNDAAGLLGAAVVANRAA
jgi:glucokinase